MLCNFKRILNKSKIQIKLNYLFKCYVKYYFPLLFLWLKSSCHSCTFCAIPNLENYSDTVHLSPELFWVFECNILDSLTEHSTLNDGHTTMPTCTERLGDQNIPDVSFPFQQSNLFIIIDTICGDNVKPILHHVFN